MAGYFDRSTERCPECDGHWRHIEGCSDYEADRLEHPRIYEAPSCAGCGESLARQAFLMVVGGNYHLHCEPRNEPA